MHETGAPFRRKLIYSAVAAGILLWASAIVYAAAALVQVDFYLISYYVADYTFGFVRRGLAGEMVGAVSSANYLRNALAMRWTSTAIYICALLALAWAVWGRSRTERRTMLALLVPVLPFGIPYAVFSARPDLFGAAAFIALSLFLTFVRNPIWARVGCGAFGITIAALVFIHEGIGLEFALGAILAIMILAKKLAPGAKTLCMTLAVAPGFVAVAVVAAFTRHDVSGKLCSAVPHLLLRTPFGTFVTVDKFIDDIVAQRQGTLDYHDWVCKSYLYSYDYSMVDGIKEVLGVGALGLVASFLLGLFTIAVCIYAVRFFSGVPLAHFLGELNGRWLWPAIGIALMIPVFLTGIDWTRWLLIIAFNIVTVYLLYAVGRPEVNASPARRTVIVFVLVIVAFAIIPLGLVPGGPVG
ncbi:membrane protein [soil metagenome]